MIKIGFIIFVFLFNSTAIFDVDEYSEKILKILEDQRKTSGSLLKGLLDERLTSLCKSLNDEVEGRNFGTHDANGKKLLLLGSFKSVLSSYIPKDTSLDEKNKLASDILDELIKIL